ncbi:MAG: hypothetical protein HY432_01815 [Candidatus Liptonbacteria bacterium]|nr:hypothetical protein [Candidatus Liptonbacteria bacterium]
MKKIKTIKEAQKFLKDFAKNNGWKDEPNIDKFDHLHEELIELSQLLRYKSRKEMRKTIKQNKAEFVDGVGDLLFGICRLANQLGVDLESAFNIASEDIARRYKGSKSEIKPNK